MNKELLRKLMWKAHYSLKENTNSVYLFQNFIPIEGIQDKAQKKASTIQMIKQMEEEGKSLLLPLKIYFITGEDSAPVRRSGRGTRKSVTQMKSQFTIPEKSPYKMAKPYKVCTSVWEIEGHKCFFYGTIGINFTENGRPKDNGDLVLFYTPNWKEVDVFIFRGLAKPNETANLEEVVQYVEDNVILG